MDSKNNDIREVENALVTIKGNALRCGDNIYSIRTIVSLMFESIKKEKKRPDSIGIVGFFAKLLIRYFLLALVLLIAFQLLDYLSLIDISSFEEPIKVNFVGSIFISLLLSWICFGIEDSLKTSYEKNKYHYTHGLRVVFINNLTLFLVSRAETGFIEETIKYLELFISNPEYSRKRELVINFSDRSVNIKKADNSNIIGGNVEGNVTNG